MTKTTMLVAVLTVVASSAAANAQVYVQPANYAYASNGYVASQPVYAPAGYATPAYTTPTYATPTYTTSVPYTPAAYTTPAYTMPAYTPVSTYYAGSACGQAVPCSYSCSSPCACNPCATSYAPQAVYSPVTYAAPVPVACGPQAYLRRGLLGQPTVFVPGQPVRNLFRFLTP